MYDTQTDDYPARRKAKRRQWTQTGDKNKARQQPTPNSRFEMRIRGDRRLGGVTSRLLWLLTALVG